MRRDATGRIVYAPSDLVRFHGSPFASWMDRLALERPGAVVPDRERPVDRILADLGLAHEAQRLVEARTRLGRVVTIERGRGAEERTLEALRSGAEVVYQGALRLDPFAGFADFLVRVPGASSLGDHHYEIADTKLSADAKPAHLLALCAYAEMLEAVQGRRPARLVVVLRDGVEQVVRTDDVFFVYRAVRAAFLEAMDAFDPDRPPEPDVGGAWGRWTGEARRRLEAADSVSCVAGVTAEQVRRLRTAGIDTMARLAKTRGRGPERIGRATFARLRAQAALQIASRGAEVPCVEVIEPPADDPRRGLALLPPPSPLDVWFDLEGFPYAEGGSLEYLFGVATNGEGEPEYVDLWAHDPAEERRALEAFVRFVADRRRRDPRMHVYHYAPYERAALRRLAGRHGTCEEEVDAFLREGVLVDLYAVVRQGLRVGTDSYSIKALEPLYGFARGGDVLDGSDSIVAYHRWTSSGEGRAPSDSPALASLRDYNRLDCVSTRELLAWLRARQAEAGIPWAGPERADEDDADDEPSAAPTAQAERRAKARALASAMIGSIPASAIRRAADADRRTITERLAHLLEFHRREQKPTWWSLFDRLAMDEPQRHEDPTCLAGLVRAREAMLPIKRSFGARYRFEPGQTTRIVAGSKCRLAIPPGIPCTVETLDAQAGEVVVKLGTKALARLEGGEPPACTSLLLHDHVRTDAIEESILATATEWHEKVRVRSAIRDLLLRAPPRAAGHPSGPLARPGEDPVDAIARLVAALDGSVLCVQGPPGTGKTYAAAQAIAALVRAGRRVGVASNSHAAVRNLLAECAKTLGTGFRCLKVGSKDDPEDAAFLAAHPSATLLDGAKAEQSVPGHLLVGGTAWFFTRAGVRDLFDVLVVDEAGQVSLANLVGMAPCAKSLLLLGDPMQLPQPLQGSHPGESGLSSLDHVLAGHETVPAHVGVFLPTSRRMHPSLCALVSGAFYEDRLTALEATKHRVVRVPAARRGGGARDPSEGATVRVEAGFLFVPVVHEGNVQSSDEEAEAIERLVATLLGRVVTDDTGGAAGPLAPGDVLVVAPYNLQVSRIAERMPAGVRVGTVDRFQGQEARVAIVSLTASDGESAARGLEFVLDRRRLNVAISRAQSLAIVVGSPALARARCSSVAQMRLVNTLCRFLESSGRPPSASAAGGSPPQGGRPPVEPARGARSRARRGL